MVSTSCGEISHIARTSKRSCSSVRKGKCMIWAISPQPITPIRIHFTSVAPCIIVVSQSRLRQAKSAVHTTYHSTTPQSNRAVHRVARSDADPLLHQAKLATFHLGCAPECL